MPPWRSRSSRNRVGMTNNVRKARASKWTPSGVWQMQTRTAHAVLIGGYGPPEVLTHSEVLREPLTAHEMRIKTLAATVSPTITVPCLSAGVSVSARRRARRRRYGATAAWSSEPPASLAVRQRRSCLSGSNGAVRAQCSIPACSRPRPWPGRRVADRPPVRLLGRGGLSSAFPECGDPHQYGGGRCGPAGSDAADAAGTADRRPARDALGDGEASSQLPLGSSSLATFALCSPPCPTVPGYVSPPRSPEWPSSANLLRLHNWSSPRLRKKAGRRIRTASYSILSRRWPCLEHRPWCGRC